MDDSNTSEVEATADTTQPVSSELSKANSKSMSSRTSPAAESREPTAPPETSKSSRRASLGVPTKVPTSTTGSADTSARNSPQPEAASTYGTRSRHRGANRPNYAEDNEMDFEYTATRSAQAAESKSKSSAKKDPTETSTKRSTNEATTSKPTANTTGAKESTPTTAGTANNDSKKRKAPGSSTTTTTTTVAPLSSVRRGSHHLTNIPSSGRDSNMVSFEKHGRKLKDGCLVADNGDRYRLNDYIFLVCEPPGEPYYIARIMEFLHARNDPKAPIDSMRINWMYRPRDINRKEQDSRGVFASMHSDPCPITSIRGKCLVKHRTEIEDIDDFKKQKDSFYFSQMYDRYIHRYYDIIPTKAVINVPENVKKVLDERWKFIIVEIGKGKEYTSAVKTCKRCSGYCANDNSVDCAVCKNTYHMNCVQPPLQKKPARGFAWSCGPCSRKQERKLEARNTPLIDGDDEEEFYEEEEGDMMHTTDNSPAAGDAEEILIATKDQIANAKMWPYRYLGIHCKPTDALDYDDRIYPRASTRIGPRHQAHTLDWPGRPFEFIKPADAKKKYNKGGTGKKDAKLAAVEAEKKEKIQRPKWVVDQPAGYLERGLDPDNSDPQRTSTMLFKLPEVGEASSRGGDDEPTPQREEVAKQLEEYMIKAKKIATNIGVAPYHTNFLDRAIQLFYSTGYNAEDALAQLEKTTLRKDLKEPNLNKEELKRFEEAIAKYGSQLGDVFRAVKTVKYGDIVRFYYVWKKTDRGKAIWGSREDRKSKKHVKITEGTFLDDVADEADDSAFDNEKALKKKRGFICKFCSTKESRFWRRAPLVTPGQTVPGDGNSKNKDKSNQLMLALCGRCASLWRRYALRYESIDEIAKKLAVVGGRTAKRKADEELFRELVDASEVGYVHMGPGVVSAAQAIGIEISPALTAPLEDQARKKQKTTGEMNGTAAPPEQAKKKVEKLPAPEPPPLVPETPKVRALPCSVCQHLNIAGDELYECRICALKVHKSCYGIPDSKQASKFVCDTCSNDTTNLLSMDYVCTLCPMELNPVELFELPKTSHRKKTEREKEKERLEKELFIDTIANYQRSQEDLGRPIYPREALKSTAGYRWMHAICAIFTQGIKFWDAKMLDKPEGMLDIPANRFGEICKICKTGRGVCAHCHKCNAPFHPSCAQKAGYTMGFYVSPVKGSRKDVVNSIPFGNETGHVEAVIYCSSHEVKTGVHPMYEVFEDGTTALQAFVCNFKQADPTYTGTMRKAAAITSLVKPALAIRDANILHRNSLTNGISHKLSTAGQDKHDTSITVIKTEEIDDMGDRVVHIETKVTEEGPEKVCHNCKTDNSAKWHKHKSEEPQVNGHANGSVNDHASYYLCHKCHIKKRDAPKEPMPGPAATDRPILSPSPAIHPPPMSNWTSGTGPGPVPVPLPAAGSWQPTPRPNPLAPSLMNGTSQSSPTRSTPGLQRSPVSHFGGPFPFLPPDDRSKPSASPSSFGHITADSNYSRRGSESLAPQAVMQPYNGIHHNRPPFGTGPAPGPRSPPAYRPNNAAAGAPRPSDNPFYENPAPAQSPRSAFFGPSLDPARSRVDSQQPQSQPPSRPDSNWDNRDRDRDGRGPPLVANGASASPSLKNLLS